VPLAGLVLLFLVASCRLGEVTPEPPAPEPDRIAMDGPALADGPEDRDADRLDEAARLLTQGEEALSRDDPGTALSRSREVANRFADVPGTLHARWLEARAHGAMESWEEAAEAVESYLDRGPATSEARAEGLLFRARARISGSLDGAIESLFDIPDDGPAEVMDGGDELAEDVASRLDLSTLRDLVAEAPPHPRIYPVFQVELAIRRALLGDDAGSREMAEAALDLSPGARTADRARALRDGRVDDLGLTMVSVGAVFSEGGPPSLRNLSTEIRSGVEVALTEAEQSGHPVRFEVLDDQASSSRVTDLVRQLESSGAAGVIGPLEVDGLRSAAGARQGSLPIISPTARMVPDGASGVFSLAGVDPGSTPDAGSPGPGCGGSERHHPPSPYRRDAGGGPLLPHGLRGGRGKRDPDPHVRTWHDPISPTPSKRWSVWLLRGSSSSSPARTWSWWPLRWPTSGSTTWTSRFWAMMPGPRSRCSSTCPLDTPMESYRSHRGAGSGPYGPEWERFVERYENQFRRTLRSPVPALGYDAARLLLHASREGGGTRPEGTARALEAIRDFPGATGVLSVENGRLQRSFIPSSNPEPASRALQPLTPRARRTDPRTDIP
jgi:hypothetical protein